ncbi:hypothetical protein SE17_37180, partial [Kouleothrix aurantiaca]
MFTRTPIARRQILKMGAVGIGLLLAGCGANATSGSSSSSSPTAASSGATSPTAASGAASTSATATGSSAAACVGEIPEETAGPYPADGSNASNQSLNA